MQDNTALLNAVSANLRKVKKKRELAQEAMRLIGEEDPSFDPAQHKAELRKLSGGKPVMGPTDEGLVFYPGLGSGIPLSGPINPKEMMNTFFREDLPTLFPEAAATMAQMSVSDMVGTALDQGMFVLFGENGTLNQILAKNPNRVIQTQDQASLVKRVFDNISSEITWLTGFNSVSPDTLSPDAVLGNHLLNWKRA